MAPILYAHRGASRELPENTLQAFARALDLGAHAIETDAHLSADGHVVLSHDATGKRRAGVARAIAATSLAELQLWDVGRGFRMPTLEQALLAFPGVRFNVDLKAHTPAMLTAVLALLRRLGAEERVLIASFSSRILRDARLARHAGGTCLTSSEVVRVAWGGCLTRRWPIAGTAAQIPRSSAGLALDTAPLIARCHALGLRVDYWTINDAATARELLARGADGIMTDDPAAVAPAFSPMQPSLPPQK